MGRPRINIEICSRCREFPSWTKQLCRRCYKVDYYASNRDVEELKKHLESKFHPGMTWTNWSKDGWHIDHIRPLASFDLTDPVQFKEACSYTNLQPMWAEENLKKGDMYAP